MSGPRELDTPRLRLLPADPVWALAVADFYARNAAHLAPWEPRRAGQADPARQVTFLSQAAMAAAEGLALRWLLSDDGRRVVGVIGVSNIVRGHHQSASLGYALDAGCEGQGLMHEALDAVITEVFAPPWNLHRLQAAWQPHNRRSERLLERLGFRPIGLAKDYLCIAGAWCDHRLGERLNPQFRTPEDWAIVMP